MAKKQLAIIGNGPSRDIYLNKGFKGDVCICNIPQIDVPYDYISIVDRKAMDYIHNNNLKFNKPILTTPQLQKEIQKYNIKTDGCFTRKLMNSAATAAFYFATTNEYDMIWLFGCNALWSETTTSSQDELIPRPKRQSNLHNQWRGHWKTVWETGKNFIIVYPYGETPEDYGKNVVWYTSKERN
ncbi:MAG: hypothetical protein CMK29_00045 [Porticoccaceae bacterium]|jgi:hypothetical protein|nr:hypothetical protein [Porticoccaceae bacterium]|tara:strand:- start:46 stop:597 length:552 start_codon:yes stop_codon:yes gene_type:complete